MSTGLGSRTASSVAVSSADAASAPNAGLPMPENRPATSGLYPKTLDSCRWAPLTTSTTRTAKVTSATAVNGPIGASRRHGPATATPTTSRSATATAASTTGAGPRHQGTRLARKHAAGNAAAQ